MSISKAELIIKAKISKNETIELIDYLNMNTKNYMIKINNSGVLRQQDLNISFKYGENLLKTENDLVKIIKNENTGRYIINAGIWPKNLSELVEQKGAFMVYRGLTLKDLNENIESRFYKLSQGDIFKIGRMYLKVLEIHLNKDNLSILSSSNSSSCIINQQQIIKGTYSLQKQNQKYCHNTFNKIHFFYKSHNRKYQKNNNSIDLYAKRKIFPLLPVNNTNNELFLLKRITSENKKVNSSKDLTDIILKKENIKPKTKPTCRICYGEDTNEKNPLICPCICKGYMKYIHYECLKNWLNSKIEDDLNENSDERNPDCITYKRKNISCEICKEKFPDYIIHNNIYYNIIFYKPKFSEFIILESLNSTSSDKNKYIHIISLDNKRYITIGRSNDCDLTLPELSVSRNHCIINREQNQVFLQDNNSKFATLVLIQNKNIIVNDFMPLNIQINKTFIKFKLDIPFSFSCCERQDTKELLDYQVQNKKCFNVMNSFIIKEDNYNNNSLISEKNNIDKTEIKNKSKKFFIDENSEDDKDSNKRDDLLNNNNKNLIEICNEEKENNENNDIINLEQKNNDEKNFDILNKKNNIDILGNTLLTRRIKRLRIKEERNPLLKLPQINDIDFDKMKKKFYLSLSSDKNFDLKNIRINRIKKYKVNIEPSDSSTNIKNNFFNKKNFLSPYDTPEISSEIFNFSNK